MEMTQALKNLTAKTSKLILFMLAFLPAAEAQTGWFPLELSWEDTAKTLVDASDLLIDYPGQDPATVIEARGPVRAGADGHFYFEKTGRRARFWGVNFTFNANFPPCPDEPMRLGEYDVHSAEKIARRLAKLGVNVVRFHHMDTQASPSGIWDKAWYPNDTQHLDPGQIKRLDYLISELKKNGIYANINLKVGRRFGAGDGIQGASQFTGNVNYFQGVSHFDQRMIDLQQDYARLMLTHVNPYTGKTYADDPAVAFVEIANEDSMFGNLLNDGGLNYLSGVTGSLPDAYSRELDGQWNAWLAARYAGRDALDAAWKSAEAAADTSDKMRNGGFENQLDQWRVSVQGTAKAAWQVVRGAGPDGSAALRIDVTPDGTTWHVQLVQEGHSIEKDKAYEFAFYAKASTPGPITANIMRGAGTYQNYGLSKTVQLTSDWQRFTARFRANATDPANAGDLPTVRPTFDLGATTNTIWIDQVEFRRTVAKGLEVDEDIGSVRRPIRSDLGSYTEARVIDQFRFYSEVDEKYFTGMRAFLKNDLGVKALVTGTAPWWAYLGDTAIQAKLDYVDAHYYWDHPSWPGVPAWSATGWRINNTPWINQLQDFSSVASQAVAGKPFSVSEFNEVFPNRYALEGPLLYALVGNLQDWDAMYMFDYCGSSIDYAAKFTKSFFSHSGNPIKSAQLPIASRMFIGRQSSPAPASVNVELNPDELALGYVKGLVGGSGLLESKGLDKRTFLKERLRISRFDRSEPVAINHSLAAGSVASGAGETLWNRDNTQASYMRVKGSSVQGAIGFLQGIAIDLGDWSFQTSAGSGAPGHLAVLLQSRDGEALRETRHMILSVWTEHQNTAMQWNSNQTSVENQWGYDPVLVRPAQVDLTLKFPSARALRVYPLDSAGVRKDALSGQQAGNATRFQIDTGTDQTVWYEVEVNDPASAADFTVPAPAAFPVFTDPGSDSMQLGWTEIENRTGPGLRPSSLLEYFTRGVLTSVVRLPAATPLKITRAPLIYSSQVDTAVALLNLQPSPNAITLRILDSSGAERGKKTLTDLAPGQATAFFVREQFDLGSGFEGTVELSSAAAFYSITLRSIVNAAGDFSLTPYPPESTQAGPVYFSHLTADPSYSSDILLWNSQAQSVTARVDFFSPAGQASAPAGLTASSDITLAAGQMRRISLAQSSTSFFGYARLTLLSGSALPSATAVIRRWENGSPASEAGIPATPAVGEQLGLVAERPGQRTGLAILNTSAAAATVDLELIGTEQGISLPAKVSLTLNAGEKRAFYLYEVFPDLPSYVTGTLRISSNSGVAVLSLLGATNSRGEYLIASLTGEPGAEALLAGKIAVLPRLVVGAGYRTVLYLLPDAVGTQAIQGTIRFHDPLGALQPIPFR